MKCHFCGSPLNARGECLNCYRRRCARCHGVLLQSQSIWYRPYGDAVHIDQANCAQEKARRQAAKAASAPRPAQPRRQVTPARVSRRQRCAA